MFQLEFGQRLVAKPGDKLYGRLSVNANFWATCSNVVSKDARECIFADGFLTLCNR